jgi:cob(I)alamin adenosyltransferase
METEMMMKIYTRAGDEGYTSRPGGRRLRKSDPRMNAQGDLDELNCNLGLCACLAGHSGQEQIAQTLGLLQQDMLKMGAQLAATGAETPPPAAIDQADVTRLEQQIDAVWQQCGPLEHFIIPGGCELACRLHVTRTVCRRAERSLV